MKPSIWGPFVWSTLHFVALGYPKNPTMFDKSNYKTFFASIGSVLPCTKCTANYAKHFAEFPIDTFLDSRESLFLWTVKLHNIVNAEKGKEIWSIDRAKKHYNILITHGVNLSTCQSNSRVQRMSNDQVLVCITIGLALVITIFLLSVQH